jgi:toxin-antitoxin system PIN domain toxin
MLPKRSSSPRVKIFVLLVDANLLVYAGLTTLPQHEAARAWLDKQLNSATAVGLPWASLLSFLRLATNRRIFERPASLAAAWSQVEEWLDCPPVWIPEPTEAHRQVLPGLLSLGGHSDLIPDIHLAALAIEHGLILCSADGDFARFPGLRWRNPLRD